MGGISGSQSVGGNFLFELGEKFSKIPGITLPVGICLLPYKGKADPVSSQDLGFPHSLFLLFQCLSHPFESTSRCNALLEMDDAMGQTAGMRIKAHWSKSSTWLFSASTNTKLY